MAKQSKNSRSRPARGGGVNEYGWRRLPGSSRNYRNVSDAGRPIGQVISERQMTNISREGQFGEKISKERYTREIKSGTRKYFSATELRQRHAKDARFIKQFVPEMTPADKRVAYKWLDLKRNGKRGADGHTAGALAEKEQGRFHALFTRYNRNDIRQLFGSEAKDVGRFGIAA
jgi:hypothetical protein